MAVEGGPTGERRLQGSLTYVEAKQTHRLEFSLQLPVSAWLTGVAISLEEMGELLVSGKLAFMLSSKVDTERSAQVDIYVR